MHEVAGNGFDYDLARKYYGVTTVDWSNVFGFTVSFGSGSTRVKTTATKTVTKYFHDCTKCGKSEMYDTTETVDPGTNWTVVGGRLNNYYNEIWYDINNVPQSVRDAVAREQSDIDDWLSQLAS